MKNQTTSRPVTPPGDAHGGKSVEIERFAWCYHAKARGIAAPEYLGCGEAWDVAPSRGAHNVRPATVILPARLMTVRKVQVMAQPAILPQRGETPDYPALWRSTTQLAILALDHAEYAQLRASGRVHKLPTKAKRARARAGGLVSEHLEDFRTPSTPAIGAGRITPPRAIGARGGWCAEYAHTTDTPRVQRGPARFARVRQIVCHARRAKHAACKASTIRAIDTRKGVGTIIAAFPLTPHLVRAVDGVSARRDVVSRIAEYATARGWHTVCAGYDDAPAQTAPAPSGVPAQTAPVGPRIIPADMAHAKGLAKRKHDALGPAPTPLLLTRVTED